MALDVQFGWVPTATRRYRVHVPPGDTVTRTFLVRRVGERVEQVFGEVILNGLPASSGSVVDSLVGGRSCSDATDLQVQPASTYYSLYVLSADDRSGCAGDAEEVSFTVDGTVAVRKRFAPGTSGLLDLIAGPAPMRFSTGAPEGTVPVPYVGSIVCGEARSYGGILVPPNFYRVYVFPEALRPGCGAPGRIVTIRAGGAVILATPWQEGIIYDLTVLTPVLPDAGSQPGSSDDGSLALGLAALAVAASALTVLLGRRLRRGQ